MGIKVLYIEDDEGIWPISLDMAREIHPDDEIVHAADLKSSMEALKQHGPFDVIVSDLDFPVSRTQGLYNEPISSGIAFAKTLNNQGIICPFFIMSGARPSAIQKQMRAEGLTIELDHIFTKPQARLSKIISLAKEKFLPSAPIGSQGTLQTRLSL